MRLDLFDSKAVDESVVFPGFRTCMFGGYHLSIGKNGNARGTDGSDRLLGCSGNGHRSCSSGSWLLQGALVYLEARWLQRRRLSSLTLLRRFQRRRHRGLLLLNRRWHRPDSRGGRRCVRSDLRHLSLLPGLLIALLQCLHLLLLLMTSMNRFPDWAANRASHILTPMVMAQDVTRADAMRNQTFLILTLGNVLPQTLHSGAMGCHWAPTIFMLTLGRVTQ
mmetsp:Transcript_5457/g.10882  ORF Transcript_5457/g.10882 Transcript_5457/m.10882 type:complete len:221 (+) Transcript_5457:1278-1940(+)